MMKWLTLIIVGFLKSGTNLLGKQGSTSEGEGSRDYGHTT